MTHSDTDAVQIQFETIQATAKFTFDALQFLFLLVIVSFPKRAALENKSIIANFFY
jgi:hypothetical protein